MHVVVLGGGACGMTGALALARAGVRVTVLEREPRPGGLCGTVERDGFRFDLGGHRFLARSPALVALVRELVGGDLLLRTRSSVVLHGGERYRYPLELDDVVRRFGLRRGARAVASYLLARFGRAPDRTFEQWVVRRFGRHLYDAFFGPYTEKLWGLAPSRISADWAAQRISLPSLAEVLLRLGGVPRPAVRTYARRYLYPRLGIGQIFERMAAALGAAGGALLTGARAVGLARDRRGAVRAVQHLDRDGRTVELPCDALLSTVALPALVSMLDARPSPAGPAVRRAAAALGFRAIRLLNVLLDGPPVSPHTWMYVSEPRYLAARIQEPRHRSPDMAPPGRTSLMLEIPCAVGDEVFRAPDDAIYARCMDDLARLGLGDLCGRTMSYFSTFVEEGYPVYHLDYRRDRARALGFVDAAPNVVSCGRQGAFRYVFMDTAMEMGQRAADALLGRGSRRAVAELDSAGGLIEARALTA